MRDHLQAVVLFGRRLAICVAVVGLLVRLPDGSAGHRLDNANAFVHLVPDTVFTVNGCARFEIAVTCTLTDARVFSLRLFWERDSLAFDSLTAGSDPTLYLMPAQWDGDTLILDGFFHPNFSAGGVTIAVLHGHAVTEDDYTTTIGFVRGEGYSGPAEWPEAVDFDGDSTIVIVEGTRPRAPQGVIIVTLPYPAHDDSLRLQWLPVTMDVLGDPVVDPLYSVYLYDVKNDSLLFIAETPDTFLYDRFVHYSFFLDGGAYDSVIVNVGHYWVRACRTR